MVAGSQPLDYAVIEFDPAKVQPLNTVNGSRSTASARTRPSARWRASWAAPPATPAASRGVPDDPASVDQVCGQPGSSGAPVTVNNKLVGMIHGAFSDDLPTCVVKYVPLHTPAVTVSMNAVIADLDAKSRPGAGYVPIA